ncbi:hypothetical protein TUM20985_30280 [Mycobacterium antarcticum]|uniref:cellulase family glycosylhydrolase n=1 Tax=Mycolicibacterium sp. TUM20985 TaxID=3023370 RepID=UPI002573CAFB|nr:cellulase family glycosylhydrolase [Mycolicibacterium sp. TUM20985]BDX32481.1 hypothetical protein TUM20985_30280 [Mycolicibacterium sp. TUM20985]
MKKYGQGVFKAIAMRGIVVAIPVAMASAYASNLFVPVPPRIAAYEYQQVAEITTTPSTVGIAASTLYGQTKAQIDAQLDEMQALGVENIRVFVPWGLIEISDVTPGGPNQYYWNLLDTVMTAAKERNMGVLAEINSTPYWGAADGSTSFSGTSSPNIAAYAAFVSDFVAKYGDVVSAYEIWNEPNAVLFSNPVDPAAYAALVKAAYLAIKPTDPTKPSDPTATVIAGAVGHVINFGNLTMDPVDFVQAMIAADPTIGNYFDALSYHPYDETMAFSAGNVPANSSYFASDTAYNQVKDLMALFPTKKVWLTEFGVPTYSYTYTDMNGVIQTVTVTQTQQNALIKDLVQTWQNFTQAGPIFLYNGRDVATGAPGADNNYGIWDQNGAPKLIAAFLAQWFIDHPQGATGPTSPGTPGASQNPLQALFAAIVAQISNFIAQAQTFFTAFVQAIANLFGSLGGPAVNSAAPLSLRVASAAASDTSTEVDDSASATVETAVTSDTKGTAEAAPAVDVVPAAETSSAVDAPAEAVTPAAEAAPAGDAAVVPEVEKAPVVEAVVEVVEPEAEPVVTKTPEVTEATTPAKESDTTSSSTTKDASDEKSSTSDKKDSEDSDTPTSKTKGDNDTSTNKTTPKTTASAAGGGSNDSDGSSSSSTSSGGGSDGGGGSEG